MRVRVLFCCVVGAAALAIGPGWATAETKFVPQGHTYTPENNRLPLLNSRQDRINSQADLYESEIYRIQRERAILESELTRHMQHDFPGGFDFEPRY